MFSPRRRSRPAGLPRPTHTAVHKAPVEQGAWMQVATGGLEVDTRPWTAQSTPAAWLAASRGPHNALLPQSTCELEADCVAPDILNRRHAVRCRLADASDHDRLVESLALIWQEERARRGGASPPPPPPSPPRRPMDVCGLVTAARVDFEGIVRAVRPEPRPSCSSGAWHVWPPLDRARGSLYCVRRQP